MNPIFVFSFLSRSDCWLDGLMSSIGSSEADEEKVVPEETGADVGSRGVAVVDGREGGELFGPNCGIKGDHASLFAGSPVPSHDVVHPSVLASKHSVDDLGNSGVCRVHVVIKRKSQRFGQ